MNDKSVNDIILDNIDLDKHKITILAGTKLYRIVDEGIDPIQPIGKENRFASEPSGYTPARYKEALNMETAVTMGTGTTCLCESLSTAKLEVGGDLENKDVYIITLKSDIEIVNMDSICKAEGVPKPYTGERTKIWHRFYGKKNNGLRYESAQDPTKYNIVIFPDWVKFPLREVVEVEKINE